MHDLMGDYEAQFNAMYAVLNNKLASACAEAREEFEETLDRLRSKNVETLDKMKTAFAEFMAEQMTATEATRRVMEIRKAQWLGESSEPQEAAPPPRVENIPDRDEAFVETKAAE